MTDSKNGTKRSHPKDPLHGISLKEIMTQLEATYGWEQLANLIPINCFKSSEFRLKSIIFKFYCHC